MKRLELSNKILGSFQDNWDELSWEKKRHFSYRAALISEDAFWQKQLQLTIPKTQEIYDEMLGFSKDDINSYLLANPYIFSNKLNDQLKRKPIEEYIKSQKRFKSISQKQIENYKAYITDLWVGIESRIKKD